MTPGGYILLIVVSVCVLALIYIWKKQRDLDDLDDYIKRKEKEKEEDSRKKKEEDKNEYIKDDKVQTHSQYIIYEFNVRSAKRICPFCDGENSIGAKICNICGRDL